MTAPAGPRGGSGALRAVATRATVLPMAYVVLAVLPLFLVSAQSVVLQRDLGFGQVRLGLAVSACYGAAALTAPLFGRLMQRRTPELGLRLAALLSLASLLILAASSQWWQLIVAMAVCGAANAGAQIASNLAVAGSVAAEHQGLAFGAKQAAVPVATLVAGFAAPTLGSLVGWRGGVLIAGAVVAATLLLRPRFAAIREPPERRRGGRDRTLVLLGISGLCAGAIGNALPAFTVGAAVSHGFTAPAAALLAALGGAAAATGRVLAGAVADRRGSPGLTELAGVTAVGAAGFAALVAGDGIRWTFAPLVLVAFGGGWGWAGVLYYATVRTHPATAAAASGYVVSWVYTGNVLGPPAVGAIIEVGSFDLAWAVSSAVLVISALTAVAALRSARRTLPDEHRTPPDAGPSQPAAGTAGAPAALRVSCTEPPK